VSEIPAYIHRSGDAVIVDAFVQPRSAKNALVGLHGRALKVKVTAPPVDGKANEAIEELFAHWLNLRRGSVEVVAGHSSRHKRIRVSGTSPEAVATALALVLSSHAHDGGQEALSAEKSLLEERHQEVIGQEERGEKGRVETDFEEDGR
jgi:uncharacterized protein